MNSIVGRTLLWVFPLACMSAALAAPSGVADLAKEERTVSGFEAVTLRTAGDLRITQGERESLAVEAEAAVIPKISTVVRDGVLYIEGKASPIITAQPIRFTAVMPRLRALTAAGTGAVTLHGISGDSLAIDASGTSSITAPDLDLGALRVTLSGAGNITLEGRAKQQDVTLSGAGRYEAAKLAGEEARIRLSGTGDASVNAARALDVDLSGAGEVRYSGDPALRQKVSGAGRVMRAAE